MTLSQLFSARLVSHSFVPYITYSSVNIVLSAGIVAAVLNLILPSEKEEEQEDEQDSVADADVESQEKS